MPTLDDVAQHAAVSRATVSRVINNHGYVRAEVRSRVIDAISATGYAPNMAARSMVTKRSQIIGLLIPEFYNNQIDGTLSFYPIVLHRISRVCTQQQYSLLLSILSPEQRRTTSNELRAGYVDGFVGTGLTHDDPIMQHLLKSEKPAVLIGRNPYYPDIHSVDVDHFGGCMEAITYLIAKGHRRIAFLAPASSGTTYNRMREGYTRALLEHGLLVDPAYMRVTIEESHDVREILAQLLAQPNPPSAIFTGNDALGYHLLQVLQAQHIQVPEEIAVASFDDMPIAQRSTPTLTTIHQPVEQLAEQAVHLLLSVLQGFVSTPQHILLPTVLMQRESA